MSGSSSSEEARSTLTTASRAATVISVASQSSAKTYHSVVTCQTDGRSAEVVIELRPEDFGNILMQDSDLADVLRWSEYEIPAELLTDWGPSPIGQGGFGEIKRCWYGATEVAVKSTKPKGRTLTLLRREVGALFRLRHPHVLVMIGVVTDPSTSNFMIVTELCKGGSAFYRIFKTKDMTLGPGICIAGQVVQAVAYLHSTRCLHRDIKPDNVFWVN